jgi:hypothetical protein
MAKKKEEASTKITLLDNPKSIETAIAGIRTNGAKLEKLIHVAACSVLNHADKHGDVTLANKLIEALPGMTRKNALRDWLIQFGKFKYDDTSKAMAYDAKASTRLGAAMETPFWLYKVEQAYRPVDLPAEILRLVAKCDRAHSLTAEEKAGQKDNLPKELEAALRNLAAPFVEAQAKMAAASTKGKNSPNGKAKPGTVAAHARVVKAASQMQTAH